MKKKKKIIFSLIIAAVVIILIPCAIYLVDMSVAYMTHRAIISSTPDTTDWALENDYYTVVPVIDEDSVTFYVEDKDGNIVFTCEESWRDWDFKGINIDENNVITADSSDVGAYIYKEDGNGSFYLYSPVY